MLAKFIERFSRNPVKPAGSTARPGAVRAPLGQGEAVHIIAMEDICREVEQSFTGLLLGVNSLDNGPMSSFEKSFLASARKVYLRDEMPEALLPRLPLVVPRAMQALRDSNTDASTLARILSSDIVLVAELIRLSNSAFYARGQSLSSLEDAIVSIGFNGIRQMVIGASLKPILSATFGHFIKNSSRYLWDTSMRAGLLNDAVAVRMRENRFHAYLAAMTAHTGMAVLIQHLDQYFDGHDAPRSRQFIDELNRYAARVTMRISQQWQLPEQVINVQQEQFTIEHPYEMSTAGQMTYFSTRLIKIRTLIAHGQLPELVKTQTLEVAGVLGESYKQLEQQHMLLD